MNEWGVLLPVSAVDAVDTRHRAVAALGGPEGRLLVVCCMCVCCWKCQQLAVCVCVCVLLVD
jgi:hypothetical protein